MPFTPPYPPYDPTDKIGFSYETVVKRWPIILTGIIDHLYSLNHDLSLRAQAPDVSSQTKNELKEQIEEAKAIIGKISALKYHMARDHQLERIPDDGEPHVEAYNSGLDDLAKQGKDTWFTAPWLFAECYLYRLLRSYFSTTKHWAQFDPFQKQKLDTFKQSGDACYQLATTLAELESEKAALAADPDKLKVLFGEMLQMCLWGNATDLSLLTHLSHADIQKLQSVGRDAQAARREFILRDDGDKAWEAIREGKGGEGRVDFVLDNAGFELFTDFVFADFLVTYTPYVNKVVFHPKMIPWFVSDVTPPDFAGTIPALLDPAFFPSPSSPSPGHLKEDSLVKMVKRWQSYLDTGVFALSVPPTRKLGEGDARADFWTAPWAYAEMRERAGTLWEGLRGSAVVVFKGCGILHPRRLTGDVRWPAHTPFEEAIGPLAGSFPILSLRTSKADVVVGVPKEVAEKLDASGEKWRVNGKYALISFTA
ncbi:DUF89-domain-containing protein [Gloeophyllum trabeum ATCC 11539]|uniref:Sugar phosphate phosphatase n=1 Tax=Gloeophyllum trabeum (strain ATCC 11539 / FP-39264 / Madison 617) TaxID=670483 RepID=S7Q8C0_GLOTA|nr:DUF89-domain-containing protein [Gloeophyllum trabeum ATCC 11539]EPQ55777.1 DUF89-domain-containing protein [Gloeophyllum trabeum ATCC 11539]